MRVLGLWLAVLLAGAPLGADPLPPWQGFSALSLSADGAWLATGGRQGEVLLWEASTGEVRGRWVLPGGPLVAELRFRDPGGGLEAAGLDGTVWSLAGASLSHQALDLAAAGSLAGAAERWAARRPLARGTRLSQGGWAIAGEASGRLVFTPPGTASPSVPQAGHSAAVTGLALSPDGRTLFSCSWDGSLLRWDLPSVVISGRL